MLRAIRPDFEVVKEGRILNFLSGYRRFVVKWDNYYPLPSLARRN
jgi:hypothetical protein